MGEAGIDAMLLQLADLHDDTHEFVADRSRMGRLARELRIPTAGCISFDDYQEVVNPPTIVSGSDLMINELGLQPGPEVGHLSARDCGSSSRRRNQ